MQEVNSPVSRFSSFLGKTVKSGTKVSGSTTPQLILQSTKDKYKLNEKAAAMIGVAAGSYVVLIDMNRDGITDGDNNQRYFITKGFMENKSQAGAKLGKKLDFSYSGIWSGMLMDKGDVTECKMEDLLAADKVVVIEKSGNYISKQKLIMDVKPFVIEKEDGTNQEEFEVATGIFQKIYILTNLTFVNHNIEDIEDSECKDPNED
jgi:hypothetical protein